MYFQLKKTYGEDDLLQKIKVADDYVTKNRSNNSSTVIFELIYDASSLLTDLEVLKKLNTSVSVFLNKLMLLVIN